MSANLNQVAQSWIIPYTLIPTTDHLEEVMNTVKSFINNLAISKHWSKKSLECDFSQILGVVIELKNPALCAVALRFIKSHTSSIIPPLLEKAQFSLIRKIDLKACLTHKIDLNGLGRNLLIQACRENREDLALLLLKNISKLSAEDGEAIQFASEYGHTKVVCLLLKEEEVDPSGGGNYAIQSASRNGHTEIVKLLLQHPAVDPAAYYNYAFEAACQNGHAEIARLLLERDGVDPSTHDNSPLLIASMKGHLEVVRLLLKEDRVDPSVKNISALGLASENGHLDVVKLLLEQDGVDPRVDDNYAMRTAIQNGHLEVVKVLLDRVGVKEIRRALRDGQMNDEMRTYLEVYLRLNNTTSCSII